MEDNNSLHFNENSQAQQPYNTSYDNTSYMQPDMQSTVQQPYQQGQQGMQNQGYAQQPYQQDPQGMQNQGYAQQPYQQGMQNQYGQPYNNGYQQQNGNTYNGYQQNTGNAPVHTKWMVLGIVELILCGWIWGVLMLVNVSKFNNAWKNGDMQGYEHSVKVTRNIAIIGVVVQVVLIAIMLGTGAYTSISGAY